MVEHKSKESQKKKVGTRKPISKFPIVGIGASAGGLEAFELFFTNVPKDSGMAFVVIQHLDPTRIGIMPELLQRITPMKVFQVSDRLRVKPNCVYVIPPNKSMTIVKGSLHLSDLLETHGLRLPIDTFFRSLAADSSDRSIGVILSGMGSDGSLGVKAIKEKNGVVLVQDPVTAKFDGMPSSAVDAVIADIVAPAEQLPRKLIEYLNFMPLVDPVSDMELSNKSNIDKIIILLREFSGHDFSLYKKNTLFRRIERRKGIHQIERIGEYVDFLMKNPSEVEILFKELLIGVTNFFRDTAVWDMLKHKILPDLVNTLPNGYVLRAWIPACSTGEEAYSLAIVFREVMEQLKKPKNITLQIFATDLDHDAVEKARRGFFGSNIVAEVSPQRISQFFIHEGEGFRISSAIREMIVFAPQNVIKDPPFTKLDILSCRNMLIYMEPMLQKKLITLFGYSLNSSGLMILGSAETIGNLISGFSEVEGKLKIFKKKPGGKLNELIDFPSSFYHNRAIVGKNEKPVAREVDNIQSVADQVLLQRFSPASVLVNENGDILYITGRTGSYLEPAAGKANWNIHAMAKDGFKQVLPGAFRRAMQSYAPLVLENIKIGYGDIQRIVNITIQRLDSPSVLKGMIIVVFDEVTISKSNLKIAQGLGKLKPNKRIEELELELQRANEELQGTREEMQTSQEELKSINEELQSTNEELQSTNEELTTSKEEMQSLNEELQTVNIELQSKVNDYLRANDDMKNLLNSIEVATLFLDRKLNIRRYTDQATTIFKLRSTDIGRPFTDLVTDLRYPEMEAHANRVIKTLTTLETSISTADGRWFSVRIMPYRTMDDRIDGLVITFTDISVAKRLEIELKRTR